MNKNDFYEIEEFIFNGKSFFLIWCSPDEGEVFFLRNENTLLFSSNRENIIDFLKKENIEFEIGLSLNFEKTVETDCDDFLNKWNIIDDLSKSINITFVGNEDDYTGLYSKFVCGSNLPVLNTSGNIYIPQFSEEELNKIEKVKRDMIRILKKALKINE